MKIFIKQLLATAILLISIGNLHAQENKHAQAMHTAFIETIHGKFPKNIKAKLESFNKDSATVAFGQWGCLDGGGLVPKEKIHVVTLSKSKSNVTAAIGPLYIDGHRFSFMQVPDDPLLPLRPILNAFDDQARYANSYYSYVAGDEQTVFPGVSIAWGEQGKSFHLDLDPKMNVRIIGFKDDDGFRSTYLLSWISTELDNDDSKQQLYGIEGIIYEFHCPKIKSIPQIESYNSDEYLKRMNAGLGVAHNLVRGLHKNNPERAKALNTDTLMEKIAYQFQYMTTNLYNSSETANINTSYDALLAKLQRMQKLCATAHPTELQAICHTLDKEIKNYPFQLSGKQADELCRITDIIANTVPEELRLQVTSARTDINAIRNQTADIDSLSDDDQEYLNRNFWKLSHEPVIYAQTDFTRKGEHYTGYSEKGYIEVNAEASKNFHAETNLHNLRPGRYRVSAVVRASETEHSGVHIFCQTGSETDAEMHHKEIPAIGNTGGNVWFSAFCRFEQRASANQGVYGLEMDKACVNGGQGYGWNRIYLDEITVRNDGNLTYGVSTRPEITNSRIINSHWFSACDFIVERIGD